jgi:S1-C subfamily serine protease
VDATLNVPREAAPSLGFVRAEIPADHPSAALMGEERLGAAVAVGPDRVLTAHYLVMGARHVELAGIDGRRRSVSRSVVDHESGLALLHFTGEPLRPARLALEAARPGTPVFLLTLTGQGQLRAATGHVSMVGPFETFWEYMLDGAIMTTVVNPGLAGAPLLDLAGRVLGVVSLGLAAVGRYSLAIPSHLYEARREVLEGAGDDGGTRAWLGFFPQAADGGVVVTGLVDGGPADRGGLVRGDLVLSLDGQPVSTLRELYAALWRREPGETVQLQVLRDSAIHVVEIAAGDRGRFYR